MVPSLEEVERDVSDFAPTAVDDERAASAGADSVGEIENLAQTRGIGGADGTAWMALYSQNMLSLALLIAQRDPSYEDFVLTFLQRFFWIAAAMDPLGDNPDEMWDEEDGFFYDVLRRPDGSGVRLEVRSLVGLLPLCATTVFERADLQRFPGSHQRRR